MRKAVVLSPSIVKGAVNLPAIDIVFYNEIIDLRGFNAVIFTSKQAVCAIDRLNKEWKSLKVFSIGKETSKAAAKLGAVIEFEAEKSYAAKLAESIAGSYKNMRFFYPRGKIVSTDIESILRSFNIAVESKILYESVCKKIDAKKIERNSAIIFSSPSIVECFFAQIKWREDWIAVAIGEITAAALRKHAKCLISPESSLAAAARFARNL